MEPMSSDNGAAAAPEFQPIERHDGYLPIEDHGLIGDGATTALVGRDGAITWLCLPRFDAPPLFAGLLDASRGGAFRLALRDLVDSRQYYEPDTAVLVTEMRGASCRVRVTDALALSAGADLTEDVAAGRQELIRRVEVLQGPATLDVAIEPRGDVRSERAGSGWRIAWAADPDLPLHLSASPDLPQLSHTCVLETGTTAWFTLHWCAARGRHRHFDPGRVLDGTVAAWRRWMARCTYEGPQTPLVRRSAITLKLLDYFENGGIIAAPTSSLPEHVGGQRNWDYRFVWIRDAAFSVYALNRIGYAHEAAGFLGWVLDAIDRNGRPRVLYDLDGGVPGVERIDPELSGYRNSSPVRWGNGASDQIQHDVFGEVLDCAYQWGGRHGTIDPPLWERLARLVELARQEWCEPDQGIWEVRTAGRPFTYSAAMCAMAVHRGIQLAERFGLPADLPAWRADAQRIREAVIEQAWNPKLNAFTGHLGGDSLDASLLALPLRRVIPADDPRMVATTAAIEEHLGAGGGLLYRYHVHEAPDGVAGADEGCFLLCSFWLVDNLAGQGRLDEAQALYDMLCRRAGALGLLPEQVQPSTGAFLGNYPQAFSHIGVISSGVNLARRMAARSRSGNQVVGPTSS